MIRSCTTPSLRQLRRVIAVGGGAIMDQCKLLGCKRPDVHNLYFKRFPVVHEKDVIAIPHHLRQSAPTSRYRLTKGRCSPAAPSWAWCPTTSSQQGVPALLKTASPSPAPPSRSTPPSPSRPPPQDHDLRALQPMDVILKGFKLIDEKGQDARFMEFCSRRHCLPERLGQHLRRHSGAILKATAEGVRKSTICPLALRRWTTMTSKARFEVQGRHPEMNALPQRCPRPCEAAASLFPLSVEANQQRGQRLLPFDLGPKRPSTASAIKIFQTTKGETAAAVSPFFFSPRGFFPYTPHLSLHFCTVHTKI